MGISSLSPSKILPLQKNKHLELARAAGLLDLDRVPGGMHLLQILGRGVRCVALRVSDPVIRMGRSAAQRIARPDDTWYLLRKRPLRVARQNRSVAQRMRRRPEKPKNRARGMAFSAGSFETPDIPDYVVAELRYEKPVAFTTSGSPPARRA
jgi:hypothetical protein